MKHWICKETVMKFVLSFCSSRAHTMSITGACFSPAAKVLVTSSVDSEGIFQDLSDLRCIFFVTSFWFPLKCYKILNPNSRGLSYESVLDITTAWISVKSLPKLQNYKYTYLNMYLHEYDWIALKYFSSCHCIELKDFLPKLVFHIKLSVDSHFCRMFAFLSLVCCQF